MAQIETGVQWNLEFGIASGRLAPDSFTMRYIGSKTWCLQKLLRLVQHEMPDAKSLCDPFAGTCTVAGFFKKNGFRVVTGDLLSLSYAFQVASVRLNRTPEFKNLLLYLGLEARQGEQSQAVLSHLNQLAGKPRWITRNFSLAGAAHRKFFTVANAKRIDAIAEAIRRWSHAGLISESEYWYLLACLLDASDRVANTAGTYYAYLSRFYRKARKSLLLRPIEVFASGCRHVVRHADAEDTARKAMVDVLYLDPPYNERDYGAYYHLPELVATSQRPRVVGSSGRPSCPVRRSPFCSKSRAKDALHRVLQAAHARLFILHYAQDGIIPHREIVTMMKDIGPTYSMVWKSRAYSSTSARPKPPCFSTRLYVCRPK